MKQGLKNDGRVPSIESNPVWMPRKEYLEGLAAFLKQSPSKIQFLSDWVIGEKRLECSALLYSDSVGVLLYGKLR